MGVIVLQTSISDKSPQEIYTLYKKRWQIETFYDYPEFPRIS
jgi:IS4 transposase